ncbi:MAG: hypothetical protein AAF512_24300, partial [Pseudomonadota bacterium]
LGHKAGLGDLRYFENTGSQLNPIWAERFGAENPLTGIEGFSLVPRLVDLDNDNDFDLALGTADGFVRYFENVGSPAAAAYIERIDVLDNPFVSVDSGIRSIPALGDLDHDGDLDLLLGEGLGQLFYYTNTARPAKSLDFATPPGGLYNHALNVRLRCGACAEIHYTVNNGTTQIISAPTDAEQNVVNLDEDGSFQLNFTPMDAMGNPGTVYTETYLVDTLAPALTLLAPTSNELVADLSEINGNINTTIGGIAVALSDSDIDRIELQVLGAELEIRNGRLVNPGAIPEVVLSLRQNPESLLPIGLDLPRTLINLPFNSGGKISPFFVGSNDYDWTYQLDGISLPFAPYTILARAFDRAGNVSAEVAVSAAKVPQADTNLAVRSNTPTILNNGTLSVTGKLNTERFPPVAEDLSNKMIQLIITPPGCEDAGCQQILETTTFSDTGQYAFNDVGDFVGFGGFAEEGAYTLQTLFNETPLLNGAISDILTLLVGQSAGYALIIQGAVADDLQGMQAHRKTTNRLYTTLLERGFEPENIYYYAYDTGVPVLNAVPTRGEPVLGNIVDIGELQTKLNNSPAPFYLMLVDHGDRAGNFYMLEGNQQTQLDPGTLAGWMGNLEAGLTPTALTKPRFILLGFCYSGQLIEPLTGPNRIIISSAAPDEESWRGALEPDGIRVGEFFMEELFQRLSRDQSFAEAFDDAAARTRQYTRRGCRIKGGQQYRGDGDHYEHPCGGGNEQ